MIVGIVFGAIGGLIAIFALKCLRMGNMEDNVKATMTLSAGILFVLAGAALFIMPGSVTAGHLCALTPEFVFIFRFVWHRRGVCFCKPDCAKFSLHDVC